MPRKVSTKEDTGGSSDSDEPPPPSAKKVKNVRVEVSTARKRGRTTASSAAEAQSVASVSVAPPNVEILVKKPPSIWSTRVRAQPHPSGGKERKGEDDPEARTTSDKKTKSPSKVRKRSEPRKRAAAQGASSSKRQKTEARENVTLKRTRKASQVPSTPATRSTSSRKTAQPSWSGKRLPASATKSTSSRKTVQRSSAEKRRRTAEDSSAEQEAHKYPPSDIRAVTPEPGAADQGASSSKRQKPGSRQKASAKRTRTVSEARSAWVTKSTSSRETAQRCSVEKRQRTAEISSREQDALEYSPSDVPAETPETEAAGALSEDSSEAVEPEVSVTAPQPTPTRPEHQEQTAGGEYTGTAVPENRESTPQPTPLRHEYQGQTAGREYAETAVPENWETTARSTPPRREYQGQTAGREHAETAAPESWETTARSTPSPDEYRSVTAGAASWMATQCDNAWCEKVHVRSGAVAHVTVNSGKHIPARSYTECQQLKDATNYIGMTLFNMLQERERQNLCLSVYGLSFLVALFDQHATNAKGGFKQALKYGAMVPTRDGHIAYPCEEVVTTLRRRVAEDGEVKVNTEVYARNHSATDQEFRPGKACSSRNVTSHIFTAELKTLTVDGARAVRSDVLFNTARFENIWRCSFDSHSTRRGDFFNNWEDRVTVAMMRKTSVRPYSFYPDLDTDVVCLPYVDGAICMTLLLPRSSSPSFLALTPENLFGFIHGTRDSLVTLQLPKFRVHSSIDLGELLGGVARDLDDETRKLQFRHARQETRLSVAEGDWHGACAEHPAFLGGPVTLIFDRPFYFVITDRACDVILYVGRVVSL